MVRCTACVASGVELGRPCATMAWSRFRFPASKSHGGICGLLFSTGICFHWQQPAPIWLASRGLRCASKGCIRAQSADSSPSSPSPKLPARLALKQQELDSKVVPDVSQPVPKVSLEHVTLSFARSGGAGGQNVNKVNTKVDMRFNVMQATWLPQRVRDKLLQLEKNRINSDGELFISSTKTRTQKGNIDDALDKLQQLIDAAAYEPPPVTEEKKKRIAKLAKADNERRLDDKKKMASKKSDRRNKGSWD